MIHYEDDCERLTRWVASLRKTSAATREEAEKHGPGWAYYQLSVESAEAQLGQARALEAKLRLVREANRRWSP